MYIYRVCMHWQASPLIDLQNRDYNMMILQKKIVLLPVCLSDKLEIRLKICKS